MPRLSFRALPSPALACSTVKRITVKTFQDQNYPLFEYSTVKVALGEELDMIHIRLREICVTTAARWVRIKQHLEKYRLDKVELAILVPEGFVRDLGNGRPSAQYDSMNVDMEALSLWTGVNSSSQR